MVKIACYPDYQKMGYGNKALELLSEYYEGKFINLNENNEDDNKKEKKLPPLLSKLTDVKLNDVYYLGTSFGLTQGL